MLSQTLLEMINPFLLMVCILLTWAPKEGRGEESASTHHQIVHRSVGSNEDSSTFEKDWVNSGDRHVTDANNFSASGSVGSTKLTKDNGSFRHWGRRWRHRGKVTTQYSLVPQ